MAMLLYVIRNYLEKPGVVGMAEGRVEASETFIVSPAKEPGFYPLGKRQWKF